MARKSVLQVTPLTSRTPLPGGLKRAPAGPPVKVKADSAGDLIKRTIKPGGKVIW